MAAFSQQKSIGVFDTSRDTATAYRACKDAGIALKYGTDNAEPDKGRVELWKYFPGGNSKKLQIFITVRKTEQGSEVTASMPKLPNVIGSFEKEVKKYGEALKKLLPDLVQVSLKTGIE